MQTALYNNDLPLELCQLIGSYTYHSDEQKEKWARNNFKVAMNELIYMNELDELDDETLTQRIIRIRYNRMWSFYGDGDIIMPDVIEELKDLLQTWNEDEGYEMMEIPFWSFALDNPDTDPSSITYDSENGEPYDHSKGNYLF